jgi:hypothetical protein
MSLNGIGGVHPNSKESFRLTEEQGQVANLKLLVVYFLYHRRNEDFSLRDLMDELNVKDNSLTHPVKYLRERTYCIHYHYGINTKSKRKAMKHYISKDMIGYLENRYSNEELKDIGNFCIPEELKIELPDLDKRMNIVSRVRKNVLSHSGRVEIVSGYNFDQINYRND